MTMMEERSASIDIDPRRAIPRFEKWQGNTDSNFVLAVRGEYGSERDLRVEGRKSFEITPADRRMNQERTVDARNDPFTNGTFAVIELVPGEWDNERLLANPNVLTHEEMKALVKERSPQKFGERLNAIDNEATLRRLLEVATEEDASLSRYTAIQTAIASAQAIQTVKTTKYDADSPGASGPVPVTD